MKKKLYRVLNYPMVIYVCIRIYNLLLEKIQRGGFNVDNHRFLHENCGFLTSQNQICIMSSRSNTFYVLNVDTLKLERTFKISYDFYHFGIKIIYHSGYLYIKGVGSQIEVFDFETGLQVDILRNTARIISLSILPQGYLCSGGMDKKVKIWDLKSGDCFLTFNVENLPSFLA